MSPKETSANVLKLSITLILFSWDSLGELILLKERTNPMWLEIYSKFFMGAYIIGVIRLSSLLSANKLKRISAPTPFMSPEVKPTLILIFCSSKGIIII